MEVRYIAVDHREADGDLDIHDFETLAAANAYARMIWNHLTDREKEGREVCVAKVTEADMRAETERGNISEEDWEDGVIPWALPESYDIAEGGFDSSKEARQ